MHTDKVNLMGLGGIKWDHPAEPTDNINDNNQKTEPMPYKVMYLPVDKPITDGCKVINRSGVVTTYEEETPIELVKRHLKRAELFIVTEEFNQRVIVGKPARTNKWIKAGDELRAIDCQVSIGAQKPGEYPEVRITCHICRAQH